MFCHVILLYFILNSIGGVMISMLVSNVVDQWLI
jgi:hypothetical protein